MTRPGMEVLKLHRTSKTPGAPAGRVALVRTEGSDQHAPDGGRCELTALDAENAELLRRLIDAWFDEAQQNLLLPLEELRPRAHPLR